MTRAAGKYAFGICDRTGFRYPVKDLVHEFNNGKRTGLRVGRDVADQDHPQNFIGRVKTDDPQSLLDARPDRVEPEVERLLNPNQSGAIGFISTIKQGFIPYINFYTRIL